MVTVKLFGVLRLKTGIREVQIPPGKLPDRFPLILAGADPASGVTVADLKRCVIMVNGKQSSYRIKVKDGDEVLFLSPAGGG